MDLTDLWQEHKRFILTVAGALLALLVGRGVVGAAYPVASQQRSNAKVASNLRRGTEVPGRLVNDLRAEVDDLEARLEELSAEMNFRHDDVFVLPAGVANPRSYALQTLRAMQELVDEAERRNMRVPDRLGLKEVIPTDPEEIRRTLTALNVVQSVVLQAIGAGVHSIERIHVEEEARRRTAQGSFVRELSVEFEILGDERSLRRVIGHVVEDARRGQAPYLEVTTPTRIEPFEDRRMLLLRLTVSGLTLTSPEDAA